MSEVIFSTLKQTLMITAFVLFMTVVIDYINVQTKSLWADKMNKSHLMQILIAALLGITPGCLGAFTVVSLYTHRMMGLAGLVTVMIATSGDEAFVMFALFPGKALMLNGIILLIAIGTGLLVHFFSKNKNVGEADGFVLHDEEVCHCFVKKAIIPQLRMISFERTLLLLFTIVFIVFLISGNIGPANWNWKSYTFLFSSLFLLFVFATVPDHFLSEHLYKHIINVSSM
jgi:hypothetical protein